MCVCVWVGEDMCVGEWMWVIVCKHFIIVLLIIKCIINGINNRKCN